MFLLNQLMSLKMQVHKIIDYNVLQAIFWNAWIIKNEFINCHNLFVYSYKICFIIRLINLIKILKKLKLKLKYN